MQDGKTTRIGMQNNLSVFTVDYEKYNSGVDPSRYFFADDSGYVITKNSAGEAQIGAGTKPTTQISWNYDNQSTAPKLKIASPGLYDSIPAPPRIAV